jgi:hypothetical protein
LNHTYPNKIFSLGGILKSQIGSSHKRSLHIITNTELIMKCPICNHENPQKAKFCQSCGTKLEGKPCPDCGYINREGVNFCEECGYAFEPETSQKTKAPHPQITQPPPPQVVIIKEEEKKEKRRLPGWLWAILGVVLTLTCLCSLLWFKVVDLPEGILAKLPGPVADIVEAIEKGT